MHEPLRHRTIVLASNNTGKLREIRQLLAPFTIDVQAQGDLGVDAAEETGLSFVENAIIKARHAAQATGLPSIADDSGLEVDALGGAPGIYSARYAGPNADDRANCEKLLDALTGVPDAARAARFHCIVVYLRHADDPTPLICQGTWEGRVLDSPRGSNGFGYDPVFYVPNRRCSAAELDTAGKNASSHRGQALARLVRRLAGGSG